jgi:sec-independent protein translocase protein TatA
MFRNPTTDLIVVLVIVLLIFGPKRLPGLGKQLGTGLREFKESITGENKDEEQASRPGITTASASTPEAATSATSAERESAEVGSQPRP